MMLADPRRMQPDLLSVNYLVDDVGDKLVGAARIGVMVVAEGEITELYAHPPRVDSDANTAAGLLPQMFNERQARLTAL